MRGLHRASNGSLRWANETESSLEKNRNEEASREKCGLTQIPCRPVCDKRVSSNEGRETGRRSTVSEGLHESGEGSTAGTPLRRERYDACFETSNFGVMPTSLPQSVREHLGNQAADDLSRWLSENVPANVVARDEYREVLSRLDVLENEVAGINERLDRMDERIDGRFNQMEDRFNQIESRFNQMDERIDRMHEQMRVMMRWTVGTIALFGTIFTALLAIAEFGG